ncbi:MAG: nitroreductase family protein, partial [Hyphomonadaceae bacterium]
MAFDPATLPAPPKENDQLAAARLSPQTLELLALRRSLKLFFFDPDVGPNPEELNALLRIAARVPDHGKLGPWRFVVIEGEARARVSDELAEIIAGDRGVNEERLAI